MRVTWSTSWSSRASYRAVITLVILSSDKKGPVLQEIAGQCLAAAGIRLVTTGAALEAASLDLGSSAMLLSHSSSVIVPAHVLERFPVGAVNIHSASPEFPGRDPHHFAIYHGVRRYGATLHKMEAKVDAGAILETDLFDVEAHDTPETLLIKADQAALRLASSLLKTLARTGALPAASPEQWGLHKTSRRDFENLCRLTPDMTADEVERRIKATSFKDYTNVWLDIWGRRFVPATKDGL